MAARRNRIQQAVKDAGIMIRNKQTPDDKLKELSEGLNMNLGEFARFQELKSVAQLEGRLTLEEAQTVYRYLGETPDRYNGQPVAVKIVLTQLFQELVELRMGMEV